MAAEFIDADSPQVVVDTPIVGQTTVNLLTLTYTPGLNELFVFYNGNAMIVGQDYLEASSTQVVLLFVPDTIGPDVDSFAFHTISQGSSVFIPPPTIFNQLDPPRRPNNFGGKFVFNP